jgi:multidrug efflux pump subunit AcrA (membrane-fusion protein)
MEKVPRSTNGSAVVVVVRMFLVVLAASALVMALVASRRGSVASTRRYVCPMHSEVTAASPGDCPICGMALEEVGASNGVAMAHEATTNGAQAIALAGLRESAEATSLLRFSVAQARRNALPGEVYAPAVVEADGTIAARLYRDELLSLAADEVAELLPAASPDAPVKIRRDATPPAVTDPDDAIARVTFRPEPGATAPPPGQIGWVRLAYKTRAMLVVKSAAIINGRDGRYVLVFSSQRGQLTKRSVEIGKEYSGMTAIVSGLRDKEFVVMANTSALDAERRLQAGP